SSGEEKAATLYSGRTHPEKNSSICRYPRLQLCKGMLKPQHFIKRKLLLLTTEQTPEHRKHQYTCKNAPESSSAELLRLIYPVQACYRKNRKVLRACSVSSVAATSPWRSPGIYESSALFTSERVTTAKGNGRIYLFDMDLLTLRVSLNVLTFLIGGYKTLQTPVFGCKLLIWRYGDLDFSTSLPLRIPPSQTRASPPATAAAAAFV
ncbi:hypothetical protein STEG23_024538, partial [Scotinomys teguina]